MKPNGGIKGSKHHGGHKNARLRKHDKLAKHEGKSRNLNDASFGFGQIQRTLSGWRIDHALPPTSGRAEDVFLAVEPHVSGVGKRSATLLNNVRDVYRVRPSSGRTGPAFNPLIRPISWPRPDEVARLSEGPRAAVARAEVLRRNGDGIWQIDVAWATGLSGEPVAEEYRVTVLDWYTQKPLSSGYLAPWRADAVAAYLERLSTRKGVPRALILDHQPELLARIEQWAFAHEVTVVICHSRRSWRDRQAQMS
jgi:hypothetical protein